MRTLAVMIFEFWVFFLIWTDNLMDHLRLSKQRIVGL